MDPEACVRRAEELIEDGDTEEAGFAVKDYFRWKRRGGWTRPDLDGRIRLVRVKIEQGRI